VARSGEVRRRLDLIPINVVPPSRPIVQLVIAELPQRGAPTLTWAPGSNGPGLTYVVARDAKLLRAFPPAMSAAMTVHTQKLLTPEEFASLIEIAVTSPDPHIPQAHMTKLVALGYVALTAKGPVVTGDGLVRITESE